VGPEKREFIGGEMAHEGEPVGDGDDGGVLSKVAGPKMNRRRNV